MTRSKSMDTCCCRCFASGSASANLNGRISRYPTSQCHRIECCEHSAEVLNDHWQCLLDRFPSQFELWEDYLSYRQKQQARLDVKELFDLYSDVMQKAQKNSREEEKLASFLLLLFQRLCLFLCEAGYHQTTSFLLEVLRVMALQHPSLDVLKDTLQSRSGDAARTMSSEALVPFLDRIFHSHLDSPKVSEIGYR